MSYYKKVNGKKVRVCKYGRDTELVSSDENVTSQRPNSNVSKFLDISNSSSNQCNYSDAIPWYDIEGVF